MPCPSISQLEGTATFSHAESLKSTRWNGKPPPDPDAEVAVASDGRVCSSAANAKRHDGAAPLSISTRLEPANGSGSSLLWAAPPERGTPPSAPTPTAVGPLGRKSRACASARLSDSNGKSVARGGSLPRALTRGSSHAGGAHGRPHELLLCACMKRWISSKLALAPRPGYHSGWNLRPLMDAHMTFG